MKKAMLAFMAVCLFMGVAGCSNNDNDPTVIVPADRSPDAFEFATQTGVVPGAVVTSTPAITVLGINSPTPISIVGGTYSIDGGTTYTDVAGTVRKDDTVTVQHTASAINGTDTVTTLTIGDIFATFTSTTAPFVITFASQTGTDVDPVVVTSAPITIAGLAAPAAISVSLGGAYSIDNGATFVTVAGTVANGAIVSVQHTAATTESTDTVTTLTIGTTTGTFTSTTVSLAAGIAVYNANCATCHALGAYDLTFTVVAGVDTPDLDGATGLFNPTGPPLTIVDPVIQANHPVINITTAEIFSLSFLFDNLALVP